MWYLDNGDGVWGAGDTQLGPFGTNDTPIAGDWDGNGTDEIGTFRPSTGMFYLDKSGDGVWGAGDTQLGPFGTNDTPIVGNWDGNGGAGSSPSAQAMSTAGWYAMCFPNPASTGDGVTFRMMGAGVNAVKVSVYDLGGGLVYQSAFETGRSLTWDLYSEGATPVANGIYLYSLIAKANGELIETEIGKLLILR